MISIVVAHSANGVIGADGGIPWHLPSDLRHFRDLTAGGTVVMGRKTFASLPPRFRPLPGRRNIVLTSDPSFSTPGVEVFGGLSSALEACDNDCFIIGGSSVYAQALDLADRVYATRIHAEIAGDTKFPALDGAWHCAQRSPTTKENDLSFTFATYVRSR